MPRRAGQYALGRTGFWAICALAFTEFFGDSLIVLIVMWQEISALLSPMQGEPQSHPPVTPRSDPGPHALL